MSISTLGPLFKPSHKSLLPELVSEQGGIQDLKKGGGAGGSGARPQDFFCQFRGLFKELGAIRGGRAPPPLWIRA